MIAFNFDLFRSLNVRMHSQQLNAWMEFLHKFEYLTADSRQIIESFRFVRGAKSTQAYDTAICVLRYPSFWKWNPFKCIAA